MHMSKDVTQKTTAKTQTIKLKSQNKKSEVIRTE